MTAIDAQGYYIGIDGGGTRSTLLIDFEDGGAPICVQGGPLNICSVPQQEAGASLEKLFRQAADAVRARGGQRCKGIGAGVAGAADPRTIPFFRESIGRIFPGIPLTVETDAAAALYGAHLDREGIVLVSGTGSSCFGGKGGRFHLAGGGGHIIDDGGSGYAIGRDILSAVLKALDKRIPPTLLSEAVQKQYGIASRGDIIAFVYDPHTRKDAIAACAPLITAACQAGDQAALEIARNAAEHLFEIASAVVTALELPQGPIAYTGSVLKKEPYVRKFLKEKLDTGWGNMVYYEAKADAAAGAVLMARWAAAKGSL